MQFHDVYRNRFPKKERERKNSLWSILCKDYFQRYVRSTDTVLDIGAGYCEFINNIDCAKKLAIEANEDVKEFADKEIRVLHGDATEKVRKIGSGSIQVVFMSNFLEHLRSKEEILGLLDECRRVLSTNGLLIVLNPNFRYVYREYWDFFDHHIPLSDRSIKEALELAGFAVIRCHKKFLPYTTKSSLPQSRLFLKLYLRFRPAWSFLGKQCLIIAEKAESM